MIYVVYKSIPHFLVNKHVTKITDVDTHYYINITGLNAFNLRKINN